MKRNLSYLLCLVFSALLIFGISAAAETITFSDVAEEHWAYQSIMSMTEKGLVKGTTEPKDGIAEFSPDKTMTRAEFITLVTRMLYPDEINNAKPGDKWWTPYYSVAIEKALLNSNDFNNGNIDKDITRQEMAMVMVRAAYQQGEEINKLVSTDKIADYDTIDNKYKDYVRESFSLGLICGVDSKGTFMPKDTLNRAAAATVAYRLIEKSTRIDVDFDEKPIVHTHKYVEEVISPTCEESGYTVYTCSCGDSYKDNETAKTGHSYTEKVISPTTSEQGYTLHTCSICGDFYKDNYVAKLPDTTKDWVNTGGHAQDESKVTSAIIAGQMAEIPGETRPTLDKTASLEQITNKLNGYLFNVYNIRFFGHGMGQNFTDKGSFAKLVQHEDGRFGISIFGWRKSYASDAATNSALNAVMEAIYYLCGDREVAYAMWSLTDTAEINGMAYADEFGFEYVFEDKWNGDNYMIKMNNCIIEIDPTGVGNTLYFN